MSNISIDPVINILIPVKNRAEYLIDTLKTCSLQQYNNLRIIVSDDGSTDDTHIVVRSAIKKDTRIEYFKHDECIGMRENFEFALNQVKEGYVLALGGDDGLLPNSITEIVAILEKTGTELLSWASLLYSFPGVIGNSSQITMYHDKGLHKISSDFFLNRQVDHLYYLTDKYSPMFYIKGIASINLINKVKSRTVDGCFYSCATPDGFSGIVLAGEVEYYYYSGRPYTIAGMSSSSTGLAYQSNDENALKESENFFNTAINRPMHKLLASQPYSPLVTLMTVDYLLTCRDLNGWKGSFREIDFKDVLKKALNELSLGMYGETRIKREIMILVKIAKYHNLEKYFNDILDKANKYKSCDLYVGSGISPKVFYIDVSSYGINNIYDASYVGLTLYNLYSSFSFLAVFNSLKRSFVYKFKSRSFYKKLKDII